MRPSCSATSARSEPLLRQWTAAAVAWPKPALAPDSRGRMGVGRGDVAALFFVVAAVFLDFDLPDLVTIGWGGWPGPR